jgi:WD40 repeat protein
VIELRRPWKCTISQGYTAVTTIEDGLHLFTPGGVLVHIVPDSLDATCVAFHPFKPSILALGFRNGAAHVWNALAQRLVSSFQNHRSQISNIRFSADGYLLMGSWDETASIVKFNSQFQVVSVMVLAGHENRVNDILPLPSSNMCVTGSHDKTIKVWDCHRGTCLHTLTRHTNYVFALALNSRQDLLASGSYDRSVILWSSQTFEVVHCFKFPHWVQSLVFGEGNMLYAGVYDFGIMPCDTHSGKVGDLVICGQSNVLGLAIGMMACAFCEFY